MNMSSVQITRGLALYMGQGSTFQQICLDMDISDSSGFQQYLNLTTNVSSACALCCSDLSTIIRRITDNHMESIPNQCEH